MVRLERNSTRGSSAQFAKRFRGKRSRKAESPSKRFSTSEPPRGRTALKRTSLGNLAKERTVLKRATAGQTDFGAHKRRKVFAQLSADCSAIFALRKLAAQRSTMDMLPCESANIPTSAKPAAVLLNPMACSSGSLRKRPVCGTLRLCFRLFLQRSALAFTAVCLHLVADSGAPSAGLYSLLLVCLHSAAYIRLLFIFSSFGRYPSVGHSAEHSTEHSAEHFA